MEFSKDMLQMPVTVFGNVEQYNDTISKARVRIFYKGANRNGTYITDEFANSLLATIPYAPVKGIFEAEEADFGGHGIKRNEGRIYGIVPENPHLEWEVHEDEDGVSRTYACVDVLLFTALYNAAKLVVGKSQSMELYDKSIEGQWERKENGMEYFVFTKASFLGLQVLGDNTEPCFEGASFYSLVEPFKKLLDEYNEYDRKRNQGGQKMPNIINNRLENSSVFEKIWTLLNPAYAEDGTVDCVVCRVEDSFALVSNIEGENFERVLYTTNEETGEIELGERTAVFMREMSEEVNTSLDNLASANNGTLDGIYDTYANAIQKTSELEQKIDEYENQISTLTSEKETAETNFAAADQRSHELESQLETANTSLAELSTYKKNVETTEKKAIIDTYSEKLSEDLIEKFTAEIDNYDKTALEKELAYQLVLTNPAVFSKNPNTARVPKEEPKGGLEEILSRYKK